MTRILIATFVCAVLMIPSLDAAADVCVRNNIIKNDGECWNTLSRTAKTTTIRGIWVGMSVSGLAADLTGQGASYILAIDHSGVPVSTNIGDISDYFDKLYSYPVNRGFEWKDAYILAALNARDDDSNDRLALVRFLRDYKKLPVFGKWVGVESTNIIKVRLGNGQHHRVRLSGISDKNIDVETKSKALNLLNQLRKSRHSECGKKDEPASVGLQYKDQFFSKDGMLTAYVKVYGRRICIGSNNIPLDAIWGRGGDHLLNDLLAKKGLVRPVENIDPSWSKDRRRVAGFALKWRFKKAKEKGLYNFGGGKDPLVELISEKLADPNY